MTLKLWLIDFLPSFPGCAEGTFGVGCVNNCTCFNNATCDPVNGTCNCTEEYQGPQCLERMFAYNIMCINVNSVHIHMHGHSH